MLTRLREIVEEGRERAAFKRGAADILVTDVCQAMETEVCSVYPADNDRRCYYLMATRGLKKPHLGITVALAFDEGLVGLVGRLAELHQPRRCAKTLQLQIYPSRQRGPLPRLRLACRSFSAASCWACWWSSSASCVGFDESEESFLVTLATQMKATILCHCQLDALFGRVSSNAHSRSARPLPGWRSPRAGWTSGLPLMEQVYEASTLDTASRHPNA
ncbi:hypothetical protein MJ560_23105 [Klebsiella pneumoniae]|nr:hypothetical protein MJ560_23105 [Klebsiella pneumoniae]